MPLKDRILTIERLVSINPARGIRDDDINSQTADEQEHAVTMVDNNVP